MSGNYGPNMTGFFGFAGVRDAAPVNVDIPYCEQVGAILNCTTGNWNGNPTSYSYQWVSGGTTNIGTDAASYTVTAGDVGNQLTCIVTAANPVGSTTAPPSNAVLVTAPARVARESPPPRPPPSPSHRSQR
jgi:hypothetical protein